MEPVEPVEPLEPVERFPGSPYVPGMRILLVEDDRPLRVSLARGLREASFRVDEAATGDEGLEMARTGRYDAIVLDILLPGMDGVEVCREIRTEGDWVPILILTALDAVDQRITGLNAGADDYLGKPFDFGELLARLRALTRRRGREVPPEVRVGDVHIDTRRRRVRKGERDIELTAREFDFLLFLARNAGRVVSRSEVLREVWDDPERIRSNVIDVYVSRLRRKIDEEEATGMVRTVRGVGFMIDDPEGRAESGEDSRLRRERD